MWKDQVARRCPESRFLGIARLDGWRWIISERGSANVIKSPDDIVYGLVYELSEADEVILDGYEVAFSKEYLSVTFLDTKGSSVETETKVLVYVDFLRVTEGKPRTEYIYRMNMAVADALNEGVPEDYVERYIRRFIPKNL